MSDDLLPPNATKAERALSGTTSRISDVQILLRESWNPATCPVTLLPWLAWAYSVDEWDPNWSESEKRAVVEAAYNVQRVKGTIGSMRRALTAAGLGEVTFHEGRHRIKYNGVHLHDGWPTHGGGWAWYRVEFADPLTPEQVATAQRLLEAYAPYRSELFDMIYTPA
jgi:phage tail P2-like protein